MKKLGIFGRSGSGKSTFIDLLMGFREPDKGNIIIDNQFDLKNQKNLNSWKKKLDTYHKK